MHIAQLFPSIFIHLFPFIWFFIILAWLLRQADVYSVHGLVVDSKKRREHLSEEDLQKNKAIFESFSKGRDLAETQLEGQPMRRPCLEKPPPTKVTWQEYINAPTGKHAWVSRLTW